MPATRAASRSDRVRAVEAAMVAESMTPTDVPTDRETLLAP
jgi:hypothetical protein